MLLDPVVCPEVYQVCVLGVRVAQLYQKSYSLHLLNNVKSEDNASGSADHPQLP